MEDYQFKKEKIFDWLEKLRSQIDKIIEKYLPRKVSKKWVEEVFGKEKYTFSLGAIQKGILNPIWEFLDRGGKRWRPALFLLILEILRGRTKKLKDFSIIPELIHQGSLIVDDIEDQGELRRGKPCLHKIFGIDLALNAGNFLYFFPIYIFEKNKRKIRKETYLKAIETYFEEMEKLHLGQATDIFWHRGFQKKISEKEYLQMTAFKTGCMTRLAAKLAAILAEKENLAEKIGGFIESIGIAFQIQDDILDITLEGKERKKFGKVFGNDIKEGKRSLMVIYTLRKANKKDRERLIEILEKHTDDLKEKKEAIKIIEKYGGIDWARDISQKIVRENWAGLEKILPPSKNKNKLKELVFYLIERKI